MKIASFPGMFALRYPLWSPDENGGEEIDPAFVEQPGDRMPDPDDPPAAEEPAGESEEGAEGGEEGDGEPPANEEEEPPPAAAEAGDEGDEEEEPAPKKKDWRDRQIIKARQDAKKEREQREASDAEVARLKALVEADPDKAAAAGVDPDKIRADAVAQVRREEWAKTLNKNCDTMFDAGAKSFPKTWEARVTAAGEIFSEEMRARPEFLEAVTELDNAAAVYHELAGDPDKMEEVLNLPPHKMGMELARLSAKLSVAPKPKAISKAPPPIKPLDGPTLQERALEDLANDQSPKAQAEFFRRMDAEERKRAGAR